MDKEKYDKLRERLIISLGIHDGVSNPFPIEIREKMISATKDTDTFAYIDIGNIFEAGSRLRIVMRDGEEFNGELIRISAIGSLGGIIIRMDDCTIRVVQETEYKYIDLIDIPSDELFDKMLELRKLFIANYDDVPSGQFR